jgi:Mg-chelatase subunit ChlD
MARPSQGSRRGPHHWLQALVTGFALVAVHATGLAVLQLQAASEPADLAFVTDDLALVQFPGCDAISVIDVRSGAAIARSKGNTSPVQLAVSSNGGVAVALSSGAFLHVLSRQPPPATDWVTHYVKEDRSPAQWIDGRAAIAITPDDALILVAVRGGVESYALGSVAAGNRGPMIGRWGFAQESTVAADIEIAADSRTAYVAGTDGFVHVVDVGPMVERQTIPYVPTALLEKNRVARTYAALSPDGRYLVINAADQERDMLNVIDLAAETSATATVPGLGESWGVQFNYAARNHGLLAVHGRTHVAVIRFVPEGASAILASARVPPPSVQDWIRGHPSNGDQEARIGALAWSGSGEAAIANLGPPSAKEWRVLDYEAEPSPSLTRRLDFDSCTWVEPGGDPPNYRGRRFPLGLDVVTLNRQLHPPDPSPTPTVTASTTPESATVTATGTPTRTTSPTPTGTAVQTPTATATVTTTATRPPSPIHLPLALSERCVPGKQRVDIALVIDASTTMRDDRTSTGRTKLEAAVEASRALVDTLALPLDQAAVVTFSSDATLLVGLTGRRSEIEAALGRIAVERQTRIDRGIAVAHEELTGPRRRAGSAAVMLVLTDGLANPEPASTAVARAGEAKGDGVTIFTIGLGRDADLDVGALEQMASRREYCYRAPDGEDLLAIYAAIAVAIPCPARDFWPRR